MKKKSPKTHNQTGKVIPLRLSEDEANELKRFAIMEGHTQLSTYMKTLFRKAIQREEDQYSYVWHNLSNAVHSLVSDGPLKERLINACYVNMVGYLESQLPPALAKRFFTLENMFISHPCKRKEGGIEGTINAMSKGEAVAFANEILSLFADLTAIRAKSS